MRVLTLGVCAVLCGGVWAGDWDVNHPPGASKEVAIDVTEGTWLNLDVSPDGKTIAFDLLGDIYLLPIEGGEARAITEGVAWDMQPRFSPSGKKIAFTSDRGGGDNIWVMDSDGANPKAVTSEKFRLYNNPVWTPDGEYIAARKHFTSKRSLGAGEIWLFHLAGGEGVQMVKRPTEQKDLGEPAFSPDGRYLYYSLDATPGPEFEYSKDPNQQIYAINRMDRETGEIEPFVTGPGGAVRPTPSPDGKYVAFARRVRYKTNLFLQEIASGVVWSIHEGLDRDNQETWAIHGLYPNMAWTPDSKSIVFWAGGKIGRIDVKTRAVADIPFHVKDERQIFDAVRFPVEVAPATFPVKMLRWVQVSPKGDEVAYQALGKIYVKRLPDGEPRRLTRQDDYFEFYPSWSRDGRDIVYTTWDDEELSGVRVASASSRVGEGRKITTEPGHYVEPVFSPDGKIIVYRKVGTDNRRTDTWTRDLGMYRVSARGGDPELVTKKGELPHFGASNDRVFYLDVESGDPDDTRRLKSIALDRSDERTHYVSKNAVEMMVSPDERWLAFSERFQAFVTPFTLSGRDIEIGPGAKNLPLRRVSDDTGYYLHWSGDSAALHWSLGPELYTLDVRGPLEVFEKPEGDFPKPTPVAIGFDAKYDAPGGTIALVGGRLVTMRGDEVIENGVVIIEGNRIAYAGVSSGATIPKCARVIDCAGKTLMPGMVDVHHHSSYGSSGITPESNWGLYADLAFGVTTAHNPSADTETVFAASEMAKAGIITTPRIFSTGTILYGAAGAEMAEVNNLDDALRHLRRMKAAGAISVKSYNQPRRDQRQQVLEAARQTGLMVVPEGGSLFMHNMTMIADGHTGIEHTVPPAHLYGDVMQFWRHSGTGYTPTLVVAYGGNWGENYWYQKTNVWEDERLLRFTPRDEIDARSRRRTMVPDDEFNHIDIARGCKQLIDSGGRVQLGAHGQRPGLGAHWELWMFEQGGMTPHEALRCATLYGAQYLGFDRDVGSIEAGKLADVVVLDANPLENIRNSESMRYIVLNGRVYDAWTMNEIAPREGPRGAFPWEIDYRSE